MIDFVSMEIIALMRRSFSNFVTSVFLSAETVRPQSISIIGHSNGSHFESRVDQEINLECVVSGGKPAAHIKWFRRGLSFGEKY
jgi:hypothetical protein